jgi:hypothetical protein
VTRLNPILNPTRRVVLLGASNLTISFPVIVETARRMWSEPVEIMAAMGHGRSYGQDSWVLGRKISGIFPCALWQDLQNRPPLPTTSLVTDVGNDLLYGAPPDRLINWVAGCLDRLSAAAATTVVTELPLASVERLSEARFRFFRQLLFPKSTLTRDGVLHVAREVNERLVALGREQNISVIPVSGAWYGFDPIHLKRRVRRRVWPELLAHWRAMEAPLAEARASLWTSAYLACLAPHERSLFGARRSCRQPSGRLADGTTISLY